MTEMRTRLTAKPGSVLATGWVVDFEGQCAVVGPCWVPSDFGVSLRRTMARCDTLAAAGWRFIHPSHPLYIGIPPKPGLVCLIHKDHPELPGVFRAMLGR